MTAAVIALTIEHVIRVTCILLNLASGTTLVSTSIQRQSIWMMHSPDGGCPYPILQSSYTAQFCNAWMTGDPQAASTTTPYAPRFRSTLCNSIFNQQAKKHASCQRLKISVISSFMCTNLLVNTCTMLEAVSREHRLHDGEQFEFHAAVGKHIKARCFPQCMAGALITSVAQQKCIDR
jgi:hypothetical protein